MVLAYIDYNYGATPVIADEKLTYTIKKEDLNEHDRYTLSVVHDFSDKTED